MAIRMTKPWRPLAREEVAALPGQLGVYELADETGRVIFIGYAGGRSLFGLRGTLEAAETTPPDGARQFRAEVTMQYLTRYRELLMVHVADHGELPRHNRADPPAGLGRLSPL